MKKLLAMLLAVSMVLSLAACSGKKDEAPDNPASTDSPAKDDSGSDKEPADIPADELEVEEPTYDFEGMKVTLAWPWGPRFTEPSDETDRFNARIAEVEEKLNIDFEWVGIDGGEYYDNMVANSMSGDSFGGVMHAMPWVFPEWIKAGIVADVGPIADSLGLDMAELSWNSITRDMTTYDGIQYGFDKFAKEVNGGVIFNKRLVEEAGLPSPYDHINNGTWNWETLQQYAKAMTKVGADGTTEQWGFTAMDPPYINDLLILSNNGNIADLNTNPPSVTTDSENVLEALSTYQNMVAIDKTVRMGDPTDWESNIKAFAEGNVGMMLAEQWVIDYINTMDPDDFGFVYFPKGPKANDYVSTAGFFIFWIPKNLPLKEQQAALLAYSMIFDNLYPELTLEESYAIMGEKYLQDEEGCTIYGEIQAKNMFKVLYGDRYGIDRLALYNLMNTTDYTPQSAVAEQKPLMEAAIADYLAQD